MITAAHCLYQRDKGSNKYVRQKTSDMPEPRIKGVTFKVAKAQPHPNYKIGMKHPDLALVKLSVDVRRLAVGASTLPIGICE